MRIEKSQISGVTWVTKLQKVASAGRALANTFDVGRLLAKASGLVFGFLDRSKVNKSKIQTG